MRRVNVMTFRVKCNLTQKYHKRILRYYHYYYYYCCYCYTEVNLERYIIQKKVTTYNTRPCRVPTTKVVVDSISLVVV